MFVFTYKGERTKCKISDGTIFELNYKNREIYQTEPEVFLKFMDIKTETDIKEFVDCYGFLKNETIDNEVKNRRENVKDFCETQSNLKYLTTIYGAYKTEDPINYLLKNAKGNLTYMLMLCKILTNMGLNYKHIFKNDVYSFAEISFPDQKDYNSYDEYKIGPPVINKSNAVKFFSVFVPEEIKYFLDRKLKKSIITNIHVEWVRSDNLTDFRLSTNPKLEIELQPNFKAEFICNTLEDYLYYTFFAQCIEGKIVKYCKSCGRAFETTANSLKKYCGTDDCNGEQERNRKKVYGSRNKDKSIVYMSNLIYKRLNRDVMDVLPGPLRRQHEDEAMRLEEQWKALQERYRKGELSLDDLKSITGEQLREFKKAIYNKGGE